jgi:hypothetical protein
MPIKIHPAMLVAVMLGLTTANYIYQAFGSNGYDWSVAGERSVFQISALGILWLVARVLP